MDLETYNAKEAMAILKKTARSFYRDVQKGKIPHIGKRPNMRFPKEAIDALAEVNLQDEEPKLTFTLSTIADSWAKKEINRPYESEDTVPFKTVLSWRKVNDDITMNVKLGEKILGWTTFLPLDEEIALSLLQGKIREKDIPPQAVRKWSEPRLSVYIPVIEVVSSSNISRDKEVAAYLIKKTIKWAISLTIQHDIKNWYAVGVTPEGQRLLEALGFRLLTNLEDGSRKGYILETLEKPVRFISKFAESMGKSSELLLSGQKS